MLEVDASATLTDVPRRRRSVAERRLIVEETLQAGASVAVVARKHEVNANQVFGWRKLYLSGRLELQPLGSVRLLPVSLTQAPVKEESTVAPSGSIHIELPGRALISVEGSVDARLIHAVLKGLIS